MRLGLGLGIVKSAASIYKGILDKFPNAVAAYSTRKLKTSAYPTTLPADYGGGAAAAYSLRKVKSDYEGSAVKVRRSSDGGLQDIGFDSNGNLDTTALLAFVNASGNAYTSDFRVIGDPPIDQEDMGETGGTGVGGQSIADVSDAYKFTQDGSTGIHRAVNPTNTNIVGGNISISFDYYLPSGQTSDRILFRTNNAGDAQVDLTTTDDWTTYSTTFSGIAGDQFWFYSAIIGQGLSFTGNGSDHFYLKDIVVTQTDADGHVTRWYSQSDPVDTYTADFSGGADDFVGNGDNTPTGGLSITDEYGTTIDNVLELNCDNTNDTEHPLRKNNPFGASNPINGKTLKCSFKMLVPSGQTGLVSAALSDGNITTGGILSDGKVTEQGRWTTFTDVAWTQTALQSRLIFMGLDSSDDPEFVATAGEKFYIADVVLTETTDAYNVNESEQPLIVEGGDVVTENGKAAIDFDGVDDEFSVSVGITTGFAVFGVYKNTKANSYIIGNNPELGRRSNDEYRFRESIGFSAGANGGTHTNNQVLIAGLEDGANARVYANGVEQASVSSTFTSATIEIISKNYVDGTMQELIVFNSNQSTNRKDIEWNINNHYSIYDQWDRESCMNVRRSSDNVTQDIGFSGKNINQTQLESFVNDASPVLDDYTGAAAAYSLRKLRTAYGGSAINVRRSSDGDTKDIGFDANGDLDTTALLAFVGTGGTDNGYVTTWYDQSGNDNRATADCSNPSACEQPLIVEAGDVVLDNGKPAIKFDGVDDYFTGAAKTTMDNTAIFAVIKSDSNTQDAVFIQNSVDGSNCVALGLGALGTNSKIGSRLLVGGSTIDRVGDATFTATDQTLVSYLADNTAGQMFIDGTEETDTVDSRSGGTATTIGARGDTNNPFNGAIQEVIFFDSDQSGNRLSIEGNIGRYYNLTGYRDGFVTKWYDQSGEYNHAENSTHHEQPQIVSNGSMLKENGKAAIDFDGVDDHLDIGTTLSSGFHTFYLHQSTKTSGFEYLFYNAADQIRLYDYLFRPFIDSVNYPSGMVNDGFDARYLWEFSRDDSDNIRNYRNGSQDGFSSGVPIAGVDGADFTIDSIGAVSNTLQGSVQEIIIFNSDQSTNRTDIEKNINTHFKIYS